MNLSFEKIERTHTSLIIHVTDADGYELGYFARKAWTGELKYIPDVDAIIEGLTLRQIMSICIAMQTVDDDE